MSIFYKLQIFIEQKLGIHIQKSGYLPGKSYFSLQISHFFFLTIIPKAVIIKNSPAVSARLS
ncbi:hypothetical protein CHCC20375_0707 [Bacillus licheniformis]|nr:hypothetical protein CHCC20375_0707 [Bacillus licheniformis]